MGVIMDATWASREYQEHQMAEKMKDGIQQLATVRLHAHQAKLTAQAYTSLPINSTLTCLKNFDADFDLTDHH